MVIDVGTLRKLFRNFLQLRSLYESDGLDEVRGLDGRIVITLWDMEYLYREAERLLPPRQWQAIELCLVQNKTEVEVARLMGVSETNPVAMYATDGLRALVTAINNGSLPRFRTEILEEGVA